MTKVSVVIPMYNEERYIGRCLESLKAQTFKDFEVILIDDGSKDNTIKIAESFKKDIQLTILKQKHGGPGKARNWGAKEAKGEIIMFVDADMYFDKNYIKYLIQPILDGKEIGTLHGTELLGNMGNNIAVAYSPYRVLLGEGERYNVYRAIVKKIFLDGGGFNTALGYGDDNLSHINNGIGAYCIKKATCYHNNAETFDEIFKHEMRVGSSFATFPALKPYLITYKGLLIILICAFLIGLIITIKLGTPKILIRTILSLLILFLIYKTISRAITDRKYVKNRNKSYLMLVAPVLIVRGAGVLCGFIKGICKKNIY